VTSKYNLNENAKREKELRDAIEFREKEIAAKQTEMRIRAQLKSLV